MRAALAALLSGLSVASASPAQMIGPVKPPTSVFGDFKALCGETRARRDDALAKADADGWMVAPDAMVATMKAPGMKVADARLKSGGGGLRVLMLGDARRASGGASIRLRMCMVGAMPTDAGVLRREAHAWAAVAPDPALSKDGAVAYSFIEAADGEHQGGKLSPSEATAAFRRGVVRMLFVGDDEKGGAYVAYAVPQG